MEFLKQYEVLYKKAKADLKAAKILLENFDFSLSKNSFNAFSLITKLSTF